VKPLLVFSAPVVAVFALFFGVVVVLLPGSTTPAVADVSSCLPTLSDAATDIALDQQQWQVARHIVAAGRDSNVPARGWVVALAAGLQESGLRPLPYGDRDSLGVFQQRTAWGPVSVRMDPYASAVMFFTGGRGGQRGLLDISDWEQLPVTVAAQAVQVSAFPAAYAKWEPLAVRIVQAVADVDASCAGSDGWVFPLGDASYVLTAGFGECGSHWVSCHTGQDFAAPAGTPVMSLGDGVVTYAGWGGDYGNVVRLLHRGGIATWYAHLSRVDVTRGQHVKPGDVVGLVGSTGNATGPHLHFEVRAGASPTDAGTPVGPMAWLRSHGLL